jgi:4-hydroxymandelate oxidase
MCIMDSMPVVEPTNLMEYEAQAKSLLPREYYDYYAGGAGDEVTLKENRAAFERIGIIPRVLVDVSTIDMSTTILSQPIRLPALIAPTAFHTLACPDGELATAKAAALAGTIMVLSTLSNTPLEDVAKGSTGPLWFQLYIYRDRSLTRELVMRAEAAGYQAICVTVDAPVLGKRERDIKNRFALPYGISIANLAGDPRGTMSTIPSGSSLSDYFQQFLDQSLRWEDVEWLKSITSLPIVLKGIQHPEDGRLAVEHGASAIIVSNHGGRQLDTVPGTIDLLPYVVDAVQDRLEVLMDGGIRRGTDMVKALALGAKAILIGRPILWGLSIGGETGVLKILNLLAQELNHAMALCGATKVTEIRQDLLKVPR